MTKSQKHICEKCGKVWYRLENGQLINHNCSKWRIKVLEASGKEVKDETPCAHDLVVLENDNGGMINACKKCKKII